MTVNPFRSLAVNCILPGYPVNTGSTVFRWLKPWFATPYLVTNSGILIMMQVANEYGSFTNYRIYKNTSGLVGEERDQYAYLYRRWFKKFHDRGWVITRA
jgi:hypothetical protein